MLIELFGENYRCFRDEFRLSMLATDIDPDSHRGVIDVEVEGEEEPLRLLRAAAIYGPNASGKTTVLHAAEVLRFLLEESAKFRSDQPMGGYFPFALDTHSILKPVRLGVRGIVEKQVYQYEVSFDVSEVIEESLVHIGPEDSHPLFQRQRHEVSGPWRDHEEFKLLTKSFRPNALLLSLADSLAPSLAGGIAVGLTRLLEFHEPRLPPWWRFDNDPVAELAESDRTFALWLRTRIRDADIGVVDYQTEEVEESHRPPSRNKGKSFRLELLHESDEGPKRIPFWHESRGTRRFLELTPYFFRIAHSAGPRAFFVDELDASLHPVLLEGLVRHFNCELPADIVQGQLIFATHATDLVDDEARKAILRRDQVYFCEKQSSDAAHLYSLAEFGERNVSNIRRRYLQGRYGALPSLGEFAEK